MSFDVTFSEIADNMTGSFSPEKMQNIQKRIDISAKKNPINLNIIDVQRNIISLDQKHEDFKHAQIILTIFAVVIGVGFPGPFTLIGAIASIATAILLEIPKRSCQAELNRANFELSQYKKQIEAIDKELEALD